MVKTTVYIDSETASNLRRASEKLGKSQAELIRGALKRLTAEIAEESPPLPGGTGKFHSGRADVSARRKELLKKAVREGRWR